MECPVTGFEFMIEIGMNGHDAEEAKKSLEEIMPEAPYFFTGVATTSYIEKQMKEAGEKMGEHTDNGQLYEFYKGQFLAFREILQPEVYGKDAKVDEKEKEEVTKDE